MPAGKSGAQPFYSDAAIRTCLLRLAGLDWPVPDFSTLCRRQKTLAVQSTYRGSGGPLHLLVPPGTLLSDALLPDE